VVGQFRACHIAGRACLNPKCAERAFWAGKSYPPRKCAVGAFSGAYRPPPWLAGLAAGADFFATALATATNLANSAPQPPPMAPFRAEIFHFYHHIISILTSIQFNYYCTYMLVGAGSGRAYSRPLKERSFGGPRPTSPQAPIFFATICK